MRKLFIYLSNKHELIFKLFIAILSAVLIAFMMPRSVHYQYEFNLGGVWKHVDLNAPFDFAILKSADSLKTEREKVKQQAALYFKKDPVIPSRAPTNFKNALRHEWNRITGTEKDSADYYAILDAGLALIDRVYAVGLIDKKRFSNDLFERETYLVDGATLRQLDANVPFDAERLGKTIEAVADSLDSPYAGMLVNLLPPLLPEDIRFDDALTGKFLNEKLSQVSLTRGLVRKGELIVSKDEPVSGEIYEKLRSFRRAYESTVSVSETPRVMFVGRLMFIAICLTMLMIFLYTLRRDIYADNTKVLLIFSLILLISFVFTQAIKHPSVSIYLVPCCILPIIIRVFFDTRLALFTHVVTMLFLASAAPNGFDFVFMQTISGMVTIFSFTHMRKRAQLFVSVSFLFLSYVICYLAIDVLHNGTINEVDLVNIGWISGNALITLFSYPLIYITEKAFNLTSDVSLLEMSDLNSPLLRELSLKAPGTFQHSMQVANLAEAAIYRVGGNALLVRAGALYHDIGKMDMPLYFIENQSSQLNPHDELPFEESASIIISHVIRGIEKAKKNNLPDLIIDFIRTHHGTTMVQYFYQSHLKNLPDEIVDEDDFRYPGPLPFSRETAVLMMADSVEAASRSLSSHDAESLSKLVDGIVDNLIAQNQFVNCGITFRDISEIRRIFKKMLMSFYHVRVEYPL